MTEDLPQELKNAWLRQLREEWRIANHSFFREGMLLPNLDLMGGKVLFGRWQGGNRRTLSLSLSLIQNHPWEFVQEVLYHEMAHQYVEEILGLADALPHGEAFRRICQEKGIDPSAGGDLHAWLEAKKGGGNRPASLHSSLAKARKLFALAGSANPHEAESAMAKAHELLLKHNLSLLELEGGERRYTHKQIGEVGRKNPIKSLVGTILGRFFFVEAVWTFGYDPHHDEKGRILEIYGTPENVEMAAYVHDYLHAVSEIAWKEYKKEKGLRGNQNRRTFIYGLLNGFYLKLNSQSAEGMTQGLIWKGDPLLRDFFRRRNPRLTRVPLRYSSSCEEAYGSGLSQGKSLVVHKGISGEEKHRNLLLK